MTMSGKMNTQEDRSPGKVSETQAGERPQYLKFTTFEKVFFTLAALSLLLVPELIRFIRNGVKPEISQRDFQYISSQPPEFRDLHLYGGFQTYRGTLNHWFQRHDFMAMRGHVLLGPPDVATFGEHIVPSGGKLLCSMGIAPDPRGQGVDMAKMVRIEMEFDLIRKTVTLLNTRQVLPYSGNKVFTVFINERLELERFAALEPDQPLPDSNPLLAEGFRRLMGKRMEMTEFVQE